MAKEKTDVHFSPQKVDPNRGIQIEADPKIKSEENSTPEQKSPLKELTFKTNVLELSPPLKRYEPTQYEMTYSHKLDGISIKELEEMKASHRDKIKQIEDQFLNVDSKSVNVHNRVTV